MYPVKAIDSDFQLLSKMLIYFLIRVFIGQKCETRSIFPSRQKSAQILSPTKKCVIYWNSSLFLFQMGHYDSTIVLEHAWIKTKHLLHTKSAERKVFLLFTEKVWKIDYTNTNINMIKLSCAFGNYRTQNTFHPCESSFPFISNMLI